MDSLSNPELIILAWGNISRGDDAAGPILAKRLQELNLVHLQIEEDLQLNIEHIMDLQAGIPVLFIDASCKPEEGCILERISPAPDSSISTHSISPSALLNLFEQTRQETAPDAFMLHVSGKSFELGEPVSQHTLTAIEQAWDCLQQLFALPAQQWHQHLRLTVE